jgi:hypothetical protein
METSIASRRKTNHVSGRTRTTRAPKKNSPHRFLLYGGIISSILYILMNVFIPMQYAGYDVASQTVSELSAIGAPTRTLWFWSGIVYTLTFAVFGWGIIKTAEKSRALRLTGILILIYGVIGCFWPPMHQREVLAAGGGTLTDTLHIVFSMVTVLMMLLIMGTAATALDKKFMVYTLFSIMTLLFFGMLTSFDAPKLESNQPTPWLGINERICIGVYILWVIVFAKNLLVRTREN